jgi:serine/threonine-protein kinase
LAHPNICRVYDIADFEGQHFLSMEYIDGEDLASLIKRIGYLSNEKALEIARQLAAGLSAAHEKGVLHRDLKPANIMIDGHGRVRITDFGLAIAVAEEETDAAEILGTPAYMAPEQFAGKGATTRSDIYALGLVFYEIYTGKRAFSGSSLADLRQQKETQTPKAPSEIRQGIDPVVERVIMRCIDRDPRSRPGSIAQLALALPGGDPLAAAVAAGETPSPEMVAASGQKEGLRPLVALAVLAWIVIGSIAVIVVKDRIRERQGISVEQSPELLAARAREILKQTGHSEQFADSAFGFDANNDYVQYVQRSTDHPKTLGPRALLFWRRQSPRALETLTFALGATVQRSDPPMQYPGETLAVVDSDGRLVSFRAIPPQQEAEGHPADRDWTFLLSEAGLDSSKWKPVGPRSNPFFYADQRMAWEGSLPEVPGAAVRVEAAAYRGALVSFDIIGPWTNPERRQTFGPSNIVVGIVLVSVVLIVVGGILYFVRRNLRLGRGDRRGAMRLALLNGVAYTAFYILHVHHVPTTGELYLAFEFAGLVLITSVLFWVLYIALEPFVRRRWPHILVSWTRLLSGDWRDPLLGRDILLGCGVGMLIALMVAVGSLNGTAPPPTEVMTAAGGGWFTASLIGVLASSALAALGYLCLISTLRVLTRRDSFAVLAVVGFLIVINSQDASSWIAGGVFGLLFGTVLMFLLMRFGLVAMLVMFWTEILFLTVPITMHPSAWYSTAGYAALVLIGAVALYGFRTSLAGRPLLDSLGSED